MSVLVLPLLFLFGYSGAVPLSLAALGAAGLSAVGLFVKEEAAKNAFFLPAAVFLLSLSVMLFDFSSVHRFCLSPLLGLLFGAGVGVFAPLFFGESRRSLLPVTAVLGFAAGFPGAVAALGVGAVLCRFAQALHAPLSKTGLLLSALPSAFAVLRFFE